MRLGSNPPLAGLKTLNRLESVLARSEWTDERIWEGLMRDSDDNIVCGTMSNVFLRQGARLITPTLDRCGISGVMRRWVLEQAGRLALSTREARVRWRDVMRAEEAFLTNAVAGIVPIRQIQHGQASARFRNRETSGALAALLEAE